MGKSAIDDAKRGNFFLVEPSRLTIIGIDTKDGPEHPLYDVTERHRELDPNLVSNIRVYGIIQHVVIRKDGDKLIVVAGRRRVLHAREAAKLQKKAGEVQVMVPCVVERDSDAVLMGIMASENEHRAGDPIQVKASKAARMMRVGGASEDEVCVAFGIAKGTLTNWLRLLEADKTVLAAIDAGHMSESAGAKIAALPRPKQKEEAAKLVEESKQTGKPVSQNRARAAANVAAGRAENVGLNSRKVLKKLRDEFNGENPDGNAAYDRGVLDTLNLVLGDREIGDSKEGASLKKIATRIAKKLQRDGERGAE